MAVFSQTFLQADIPFNLGNGQFRKFSKDELREYVENSRTMMFDGGLGIHIKSEHPAPGSDEGAPTPFDELVKQFSGPKAKQFSDAIKTAGWVKDLHFDEASGAAKVLFEVKSKPYIRAIREDRIRFSSPELREHYQDGLGREWGRTFAHFALTPKPRNPLQTVLKETSNGHQQYAMQFGMSDAVGIDQADLPTIQFYADSSSKRAKGEDRYPQVGGESRNRSDLTPEQDIRPGFGAESPRRHNLGQGADRSPGVGNDPASRKKYPKRNRMRDTRPQKHYTSTDSGWEPAEENINPHDKERENFGDLGHTGEKGLPRMTGEGSEPSKEYTPKYRTGRSKLSAGFGSKKPKQSSPNPSSQGSARLSEQFDTSMMDQAPGYPGAIPPIPVGPQDFDPNGLGGETNMLGGLPVENPDVIQLPDDAKRQKSEAAVQLLDQIGISLAVGTDLTKLDDSALDSLLAALKTKIKANQEAEEAEMAQMQDQQLKEQVPMIGQMSEDEADAIIGHTLVEIAQFAYGVPPGGGNPRQAPKSERPKGDPNPRPPKPPRPPPGERPPKVGARGQKQRIRQPLPYVPPKKSRTDDQVRERNRNRYKRPNDPPRKPPRVAALSEDQQMSEQALTKRLENCKSRHDKQARQGLRKLIATSKLPPGMKAQLDGDVSSVQFAESGPEVPTYTVQDVLEMFNGSCPDGMQFGDKALVESSLEHPNHPQGDRWERRGSGQISQGDAAQFAAEGVTMSEADLRAYYDQKAKQPDWASRLMPVANGNGRTH